MEEIKVVIDNLGRAFEEFKIENNKRLTEIEKNRHDSVLAEKVEKLNVAISDFSAHKVRLEKLEKAAARSDSGYEGGGVVVDTPQEQHRQAFRQYLRNFDSRGLKELGIKAAITTSTATGGGFLVPAVMETAIDRVVGIESSMRNLASVSVIDTDVYEKIVSQAGTTSGWVGETESRSETDTPTLRKISIPVKELYAKPKASKRNLEDSIIDVEKWIIDEVAIEFAEEEGTAAITGDGMSKMKGITSYDTVANASYSWGYVGYIATGHASQIQNFDAIFNLQHALKASYRRNATWLMNDNTLLTLRKFRQGDGVYYFQPSLVAGTSDTLLGKPIAIDDNISDIGAGTYPIFFANFQRAYRIVDRRGISVLVDPYTSPAYVNFYCTKRVGGGIEMYEAIKALKVAAS